LYNIYLLKLVLLFIVPAKNLNNINKWKIICSVILPFSSYLYKDTQKAQELWQLGGMGGHLVTAFIGLEWCCNKNKYLWIGNWNCTRMANFVTKIKDNTNVPSLTVATRHTPSPSCTFSWCWRCSWFCCCCCCCCCSSTDAVPAHQCRLQWHAIWIEQVSASRGNNVGESKPLVPFRSSFCSPSYCCYTRCSHCCCYCRVFACAACLGYDNALKTQNINTLTPSFLSGCRKQTQHNTHTPALTYTHTETQTHSCTHSYTNKP